MTAIILAGGKKTSINVDYPHLPPSMLPVADQPLLYWLSQWVKRQGFDELVFAAGPHAEQIDAWVTQQSTLDSNTCFDVMAECRPLGTGGATKEAAKRFPSDLFLVINGDSLVLADLTPQIERLRQTEDLDGILVAAKQSNAGRYGSVLIDDKNLLTAFKEKQPGKNLINTGTYLFKPSLIESIQTDKAQSLEYDCFPQWIEQGKKIEVVLASAPFIDVGTPDSLKKAQEKIKPYLQALQPLETA